MNSTTTPQPTPQARWRALAALAGMLLLSSACVSPAGIAPHAQALAPAALGLDEANSAPDLAADWWQGFADPQLNALIERGLAGSPSLGLAQARLARASAGVESAQSALGLHAEASLDATREHYSANSIFPPPLGGATLNSGDATLAASWEFDFFGRNRSALVAALGAQRAAQADAQAARVLLASQLAREYVQLANWLDQRELLQRNLSERGELLALIRQRVQAGLDTRVELRQGEGALPEARAQLEAVDEQISLTRHALAALSAQSPDALAALSPRLSALQALPLPALLPADLLARRADVSAARWRVEAATSQVAATRAQFYPNVNLMAFAGLASIGLDRLFSNSGSRQYGVGAAVHLPIFDAGRLRADLRGQTADLDAAVETYNAAVIGALHDAADQISSLQSIARQRSEQSAAQEAAESAYSLAVQRYQAGLGNYLIVLYAEAQVLAQRRAASDLQARAFATQVALVHALGGGYADPAARSVAAH